MWIRSQNKIILSNVEEVLVTFVNENKCYISGFWGTGTDTLGVYSSHKKAFKVLDEIQKRAEYLCPKVYQMPKDDEVEA